MSSLLSRMLNDNNTRQQRNQQNRVSSENRIAEGIQMLFANEQEGETSEAGGSGMNTNNPTSPSHEESASSSSSSNYSSGDEEMEQSMKFDYVKQKFVGHRNARTMIKEANYWGDDFVSLKEFKFIFKNYKIIFN